MKHILYALTLFILSIAHVNGETIFCCDDSCCGIDEENIFINSRLELGLSAGKFIGIHRDYAEVALFAPFFHSQERITFIDCRLYNFKHPYWSVNAGVGARKEINNGRIVGANVYYDCLRGNNHNNFNRVGVGLEWLGHCWDLRLNGYFPVSNQTCKKDKKEEIEDPVTHIKTTEIKHHYEYAISKGCDAEIGAPLGCWRCLDFYGAVGPYYYSHSHVSDFFGGQARLKVYWNTYVSFQVRTSYDHVNKTCVQGQIQVNLPFKWFCCECNSHCREMILQPVQRNGLIFTQHETKRDE